MTLDYPGRPNGIKRVLTSRRERQKDGLERFAEVLSQRM